MTLESSSTSDGRCLKCTAKSAASLLGAAYGAVVDKRGANYQIQIGMLFGYGRCPELRKPSAIELVAASWLACKPLVDLAR